jgi:CRP-like cAMP-binding protein
LRTASARARLDARVVVIDRAVFAATVDSNRGIVAANGCIGPEVAIRDLSVADVTAYRSETRNKHADRKRNLKLHLLKIHPT